MNTHKHARLTFARRFEMVKQMTVEGLDAVRAAAAHGVTAPTARKWLGRYLAGGEAALADASSRPTRSPRAIDAGKALLIVELRKRRMLQARIARSVGVSESTVSRVLARAGMSKLSDLEPVEAVVRYESRGQRTAAQAHRLGAPARSHAVQGEYTRECLAIDVAGAIRSKRVIEVLSRLVSLHGAPLFMRSDNGPEFVSQAILEWISGSGIATVLNDPGKPWQNGTDESCNGKFRDECLSIEWFRSRREAAVLIEAWRNHYNEVRPHSSLQYLTPAQFKQELRQDLQPAVF
ncbi:integrase core domain-containing protein [Variovorax sp. Varisp85]|uniref:integrase core domain-containing protein n=1 Tax=Variovorax sp. Varisp85 TaxID=3243059 RepID=UPI0039A643A4